MAGKDKSEDVEEPEVDETEEELDEEEEEEDEDTGDPPPSEPPPPPKAAQPPGRPPGRPRGSKTKRRPTTTAGVGSDPHDQRRDPGDRNHPGRGPFGSVYAEEQIEELIGRLNKFPELGSVYDVDVEAWGGGGQSPWRKLGGWPLHQLLGSDKKSAGQTLRDTVIDQVHFIVGTGQPQEYDIWFGYRVGHKQMTRGKLPLGSSAEIDALRRAQWAGQQAQSPQGFGAPSYGSPPYGAHVPAPPAHGGAGGGMGGHQPSWPGQPSQSDDLARQRYEIEQTRQDLARMHGQLQEMIAAQREGRAYVPPPAATAPMAGPAAGVGNAAPTAQVIAEEVGKAVSKVVPLAVQETLKAVGLGQGGAHTADALGSTIRQGLERVLVSVAQEGISHFGSQMKQAMRQSVGMGQTPEPELEPEPEVEEPSAPADDFMPFAVKDTGARWGDGRPVMAAINKETRGVDLAGFVMTNPIIGETGLGALGVVAAAAKDWLAKVQLPDGNQVVNRTPRGAVDATPREVPPPPSPPAPAAPPAASNGASPPPPAAREPEPEHGGGFATH